MNVYVETNFLLELVFEQEQAGSCEEIIELCASQKLQMVVPAYSIVEPYEKLVRQTNSRKALQENLDVELRQLARSTSYQQRFGSVQDVYELLTQSSEQERERFALSLSFPRKSGNCSFDFSDSGGSNSLRTAFRFTPARRGCLRHHSGAFTATATPGSVLSQQKHQRLQQTRN